VTAARVILGTNEYGDLETFGTPSRLGGGVIGRKRFPSSSRAEALLHARGLSNRLQRPLVDRTAKPTPPAIVVAPDPFDLGFDDRTGESVSFTIAYTNGL